MRRMDLLATLNGRRGLFFALYFCEGMPIGFIWWTLPTLLRRSGASVAEITALSAAATLPWTLKFLAGPLVDLARRRGFGERRIVVLCQSLMMLTLLPLAAPDALHPGAWLTLLVIAHGIAAACQDVAVDALAIHSTAATEYGAINGFMQAGMTVARSLIAGIGIVVAAHWGHHAVVLAMIITIGCISLMLLFMTRDALPGPAGSGQPFRWRAVFDRALFIALAVALTYGAAFEFVGAVAGPFLSDHGVDADHIGAFYGLIVPIAMTAGALLGGRLADARVPLLATRRLLLTNVALVACVALLDGLRVDMVTAAWLGALALFYLSVGALTAASYALFMRVAGSAHAATRFSTLMAGTNACESWAAWTGGRLSAPLGYSGAMGVLALVALAAFAPMMKLAKAGGSDAGSRQRD